MKLMFSAVLAVAALAAFKAPAPAQQYKKPAATIDTLILRQICDYCMGEKSVYEPQRFSESTICLCYYDVEDTIKIEDRISKIASTIKHITIENPSGCLYDIPFEKCTSLKSLYIFGNDYNTDGLDSFPVSLLELKTLRRITFDGVRFNLDELKRIKKQYPNIDIEGDISPY